MSVLIQALEKIEKEKYKDSKEIEFIFRTLNKRKNRSKKKVFLITTAFVGSILITGLSLEFYFPKEEKVSISTPIQPVIPETKTAPSTIDNTLKDIPVISSINIEDYSLSTEEIESALEDIDFTFIKTQIVQDEKEYQKYQTIPTQQKNTDQKEAKFLSFVSLAEDEYEKGNLEESLSLYKKAYTIKQEEEILFNIISLDIQLGNIKEVESGLEKLQSKEYLYDIILSLIDTGHLKTAEKQLFRIIPFDSTGDFYYLAGYLFEVKENYHKALEFYRKAYFRNPQDQYFCYAYGRMLEINGFTEEAYKIYNTLRERRDLDQDIRKALSGI